MKALTARSPDSLRVQFFTFRGMTPEGYLAPGDTNVDTGGETTPVAPRCVREDEDLHARRSDAHGRRHAAEGGQPFDVAGRAVQHLLMNAKSTRQLRWPKRTSARLLYDLEDQSGPVLTIEELDATASLHAAEDLGVPHSHSHVGTVCYPTGQVGNHARSLNACTMPREHPAGGRQAWAFACWPSPAVRASRNAPGG